MSGVTPIRRVAAIDARTFVSEAVRAARPLIVTGAMAAWPAVSKWTPDYLERLLGDEDVQVYDDLFGLIDVAPLGSYLRRNFGRGPGFLAREYVRWYAKFRDVEFVWADAALMRLADDWRRPEFFPDVGFALPRSVDGRSMDPVRDPFPYKGLFISGRGARTRLHADPLGSDALLCQVSGDKRVLFYAPETAQALCDRGEWVDPAAPDLKRFPQFASVQPVHEDVLRTGEILYLPAGWLHDVTALTDSISLTWNFVHLAHAGPFERALASDLDEIEESVLRYFGCAATEARP